MGLGAVDDQDVICVLSCSTRSMMLAETAFLTVGPSIGLVRSIRRSLSSHAGIDNSLSHRGFETRRLPSPGLAGLLKPLPGVWPLSHANSYREPQGHAQSGFDGDSRKKHRGTPGVTPEMPALLLLLLCNQESPEEKALDPWLCLLPVARAGVEALSRDGAWCSVSESWSEARSFQMDSESDCGRMLPVCCIGKLAALEVHRLREMMGLSRGFETFTVPWSVPIK
ncbi:uncharacterized protein LOC134353890 [Mobula hypostoma]|uniref:uncharacterized protein LOC134353890 n=1 Tax=Mobula hypostoma TaxID=723540 RepID=UPI002FC390B3